MEDFNEAELFQFDLPGEARDTAQFLKYFKDLCYALGGQELVRKVHQEISFNISRGCDVVEAISYPYEKIRAEVIGQVL